ncbi:MAG TPA: nicotinate (nicotinamide) nucleotide adenylyltransferase [Solirubrobacteraceae bacterium]|nr:nicotinate (nicotinamide) nucleotide adenylyltransferase [Solirubrobacteraceae bacterium]
MLGGSFNPPHLGHIALARHALGELALDRVLLMPAQRSPHKAGEQDPGPEHRLRMCQLAVAGVARLGVSALELQRPGPSYTVDTLRVLHAEHPDIQLTFLLGADVARTLPAWREPRELLALAELAVALRHLAESEGEHARPASREAADRAAGGDVGELEVRRALASLPGGRVRFLTMPPIDVSSSLVRVRVHRGERVEALVGPAVAAYIAEHGLYRSGGARRPAGARPARTAGESTA